MLELILHPIQSIRSIRYIASQLTPQDVAERRAAKTDEEKAEITCRILNERIFA